MKECFHAQRIRWCQRRMDNLVQGDATSPPPPKDSRTHTTLKPSCESSHASCGIPEKQSKFHSGTQKHWQTIRTALELPEAHKASICMVRAWCLRTVGTIVRLSRPVSNASHRQQQRTPSQYQKSLKRPRQEQGMNWQILEALPKFASELRQYNTERLRDLLHNA